MGKLGACGRASPESAGRPRASRLCWETHASLATLPRQQRVAPARREMPLQKPERTSDTLLGSHMHT